MKKNLLLLTLLLALVAFGYYIYDRQTTNYNIDLSDRQFGVKDIETVGKIVIKQPSYPDVYLEKRNGQWLTNNNKKTNSYVIGDLLGLIKNLDINYIPMQSMVPVLLKDIETEGVQILISDVDGNLIRDFKFGHEYGESNDLPMLVTGKKQPYMMRVPGFIGSLRTRFINTLNEWESKTVFEIDPASIVEVSVIYDRAPEASFTIKKNGNEYQVFGKKENVKNIATNQKTVAAYLMPFREIIAEYNDSENPRRKEINSGQRFATVTIITSDGTKYHGNYFSYADISVNYETKKPSDIHPDNKFFIEAQDGEMYLVQQRVIGSIFQDINYFFKQ